MLILKRFVKKVEGRVEERVDLARKIAERLGMAEAVEISGLSEDQILNSP